MNFPFGTNGKFIILDPIPKHIRVTMVSPLVQGDNSQALDSGLSCADK